MESVEKFEFRRLNLPPKSEKKETMPLYDKIIESLEKKIRIYKITIGVFLFALVIFIAYQIVRYNSVSKNSNTKKLDDVLAVIKVDSQMTKGNNIKPVYKNYFDSIVFLNEVKTDKVVISKGVDDYLLQEKLIIKSGDNYYNCFCKDLIKFYKVGDKIP